MREYADCKESRKYAQDFVLRCKAAESKGFKPSSTFTERELRAFEAGRPVESSSRRTVSSEKSLKIEWTAEDATRSYQRNMKILQEEKEL